MRKTLVILLTSITLIVLTKHVFAQTHVVDGEYIKEWLVLGPFFPNDLEADFLVGIEGEANVHPKEGNEVTIPEGKTLTWKRYLSDEKSVDLIKAVGNYEHATVYAFCEVVSVKAQKIEMLVGSDDSVKIWFNGIQAHQSADARSLTLDEDSVPVNLKKGNNRMLVKVINEVDGWGFAIRFRDYERYLSSLSLSLSVQRREKDGKAALEILAGRQPKNNVWSLPERPIEVTVLDERQQQIAEFDVQEWQAYLWKSNVDVKGDLTVFAVQVDESGRQLSTFKTIEPLTGTEGVWKTYRYVDGVADNWIYAIHGDQKGYIWVGTLNGGVSRFDGKQWTNFTTRDGLADNYVFAIHGDREGNIWFGTRWGGVSRFDGKQWTTFTTEDGLVDDNYVFAIHGDREGNIWFGTSGGVSRFNGEKWTTFTTENGLPNNGVGAIEEDRKGNIWFGTNDGVSKFDGKKWTTFTTEDGLANNDVRAIHEDRKGNIWFGTYGGGVSKFDGKKWTTFTTEDGLANNGVRAIQEDREGNIWFGTYGGVSRFDGEQWTNFTQKDGLARNNVTSIHEDKEGNIWFGAWGGGVSRFNGEQWTTVTQNEGLAGRILHAIHEDQEGNIWIGTYGGLSRFDGEQWTTFTTKDGLPNNMIRAIEEDREGNIWIGTYGGVSRFDGKQWTTFTTKDGLADNRVGAIHEDRKGNIWFGTNSGVSRFDGEKWTTFTTKDGLAENFAAWAICEDREGNFWFGSFRSGVSKFDGEQWTTFTTEDGLPDNAVSAIYEDSKGNIWFGTYDGLGRYDGEQWTTFTTKDGLSNDDVISIHEDREENILFGQESGGVSFFDGRCFQFINSQDGLINDTVRSIYGDKKGNIWIGTDEGLVRFTRNKVAPLIEIKEIIADKTYDNPKGDIRLPANISSISFRFSSISFKTLPGRLRYFYQLVGHDTDWQGPTNQETIQYFNLKSGKYTFKVQAVDRDLNYSVPADVTLKVMPPWYLNGWIVFPSGGGIIAVLIWAIFSSTRYYAQRRESQQLREQMLEQERQSRQEVEAKNEEISALNEQLQDDNLRMAAELEITERIQRMILPSAEELRSIAELDIAGYMEPADDVGGDYYDVLQREGTVAISIGDVTGHGLESGLLMLMTQTAVQALLQSGETDPVHLLDTLNRTIYNNVQRIKTDKNLTLCLLDYQSGELKLSGQHEEMIVVRKDGTVELVDTIDLGFPIGLDDDIAAFIDQTTVQLQPGDGVVLYTDGITEAENTAGEQYSLERLCEVVSQHWSQSAEEIKEAVIADVRQHIGEQEVYDDITLLVMKQK